MAESPPVVDYDPDAPIEEQISVGTCPECNEEVPPRGRMAPKAVMGLHLRNEHGIEGTARKKKKRSKKDSASDSNVRPLSLISDAAAVAKGKNAPTADQLERTFAKLYGYATYGAWSLILDGDPNIVNETQHEAALDILAPTSEQALATVKPLARVAAKTALNKRFGRGLVDNADLVDCVAAIFEQARNARAYFAARNAQQVPGAVAGPSIAGANGTAPGTFEDALTGFAATATSAPATSNGVLMTPDMIHRGDPAFAPIPGAGPDAN